MKIKIQKEVKAKSGLLIFPIFKEFFKKSPYPKYATDFVSKRAPEFKAKKYDLLHTYIDQKALPAKMSIIGCGEAKKLSANIARRLGAKIGKEARWCRCEDATIFLPKELADYVQELLEGILLVQYRVGKMKTSEDKRKYLENINFIGNKPKNFDAAVKRAQVISESVTLVKDLVNAPANKVRAIDLANTAKKLAKENGYKITIYGDKELKKMKWGGLLAVNQGCKDEARAITLRYNGGKKTDKPIVIIGKGIIFDTGGYSLKLRSMEAMKLDMAGGADVLGIFAALKKLGIKKNVIGIIASAENMINENAYRPSDVITMYSGKTVEVLNTDAEGRLVLADAIHHALSFDPKKIITIATLTGAVQTSLSTRYVGLLGNDNSLRRKIQKAGREVDELGWPLPIHNDYRKRLRSSTIADLKNCDMSRLGGGTLTAAAFLEEFVDKRDWCHLDIGGTAYTNEPQVYQGKGATAHGVRMLLKYLEA